MVEGMEVEVREGKEKEQPQRHVWSSFRYHRLREGVSGE